MMSAPPVRKALLFVLTAGFAFDHALAGDRELGQYLSAECVTCHRTSGQAAQGIPQIAGWAEDQFVAVMNAYKAKQRDNPVMQTIAGRLEADDIAALAAYFRTQK
ncbi:MAG: c-type cytochrome [Afipia sp.]